MEAGRLEKGVSRGLSPRYRLFRRAMVLLGWILFGFTVHGAEKVPKEGPLVVASNHRRYADPVLVSMAVPRRIQWMAKKELFISPFDRLFFFIGAFPVDRQRGARAALKTSLDLLAANWALGIFPEGTRRKGYDPQEAPKSGIAMISARSNAPILPVFVDKVPNPLQRLKNNKLHVYIGNPIYPHNTDNGGNDSRRGRRREVAGMILREIYALGEGRNGGGRP
ncbi:MAG: Acyl-CoA:1-acyl-sn-glycerol-3-phosphate acyltransferase [uncultured Rubrobacteraceae bacterium]|uniref:Acyl-CoA:1-acyl-sn-glycerol-3-phosphate acyltransferase n=1 Tax=uncultured Rubrobacteraceae bacterium TaxID=349277 RepID=A0A6J4QUD8_9ACTN|nr:MAG: Acyl-CoA:1-acyl-sn-glycerol-3-phosphate acyltransferase [uncultured Rubrobacteraceae bacterium]